MLPRGPDRDTHVHATAGLRLCRRIQRSGEPSRCERVVGRARRQLEPLPTLPSRLCDRPPSASGRRSDTVTWPSRRKEEAAMASGAYAVVARIAAHRRLNNRFDRLNAVIGLVRMVDRGTPAIDDAMD